MEVARGVMPRGRVGDGRSRCGELCLWGFGAWFLKEGWRSAIASAVFVCIPYRTGL